MERIRFCRRSVHRRGIRLPSRLRRNKRWRGRRVHKKRWRKIRAVRWSAHPGSVQLSKESVCVAFKIHWTSFQDWDKRLLCVAWPDPAWPDKAPVRSGRTRQHRYGIREHFGAPFFLCVARMDGYAAAASSSRFRSKINSTTFMKAVGSTHAIARSSSTTSASLAQPRTF